ncbi:interleukin-17 receptor B isoform X2 [Erinaceus europaeus]|nr:interleukin-17 receptor B isoform X2 [Erinaceus europaeus]
MIQCGPENGPSPEWMVPHPLIPGELKDLQVEPVRSNVAMEDYLILMNISWTLRADASIFVLKATKICVTGLNNFRSSSCVRCNYTEAFQTQTRSSGVRWVFSYTGFPVELNTLYYIGAHNIPSADTNEDSPSMSVNFTSPGCLDHIMKYKRKCIRDGSLWDPSITACKKNEKTVEVNFTTSSLGSRYMAFIYNGTVIGHSSVELHQSNLTRTSLVIPVTGESQGAMVQLIPYFHTCQNDCIRRKATVVLCPQPPVPVPLENRKGWLPFLLPCLLVAIWVLVIGIYLAWRHERIKKMSFPATTLLPLSKVLVVYPPEICFHHTVCYFTAFLQNHCRSEVIIEPWQKKKIAELGPVQWLTAQKKASDKVIFLLSNDASAECDGICGKSKDSPGDSSQDLFPLAFNLFCSDLRSQALWQKYMVVYFREADTKDDYSALSVCPKYHLMKEATAFCTELLRVGQQASKGKRRPTCHKSCSL